MTRDSGDPVLPLPGREERRRLREAKSLSHADIAARVGVTAATVRAWESGRTAPHGREREAYAALLAPAGTPGDQREDTPAAPAGAGRAGRAADPAGPGRTDPTDSTDRRDGPDGPGDHRATDATADRENREGRPGLREGRDRRSGRARGWGPGRRGTPGRDTRSPGPRDEAAPVLAGVATGPVQPPPRPARPPAASTGSGARPAAGPGWGPGYEPATVGLTPAEAFDELYGFCAPALLRQTYLLTGRRELARESVERAFQTAWQRWPEVAVDRDPAGWVRAVAYEYALSPWHRVRPRYRHAEPPPADAADRALLSVLLDLPPMHRRTLLLYDGVGLDLPETAAETEASTPAAANRLLHARETVATRLPELAAPEELHRRLAEIAGTERLRAGKPFLIRWASERRALHWTRAAMAFTAVFIGITSLTLKAAPDHYEPPLAPGATVSGLPPKVAPGPLSHEELALRARLRAATASGPERLVPDPR
ncbi:helix-turn-helix domain-containing protein [Streptomyces sp. NPDC088736]|uniref:helix-turn-helix domain-containing protein n=1 Tax=Streptomyces sp. NPDC088736 TaxID=3365881 RepID=UPI00380CFEEF